MSDKVPDFDKENEDSSNHSSGDELSGSDDEFDSDKLNPLVEKNNSFFITFENMKITVSFSNGDEKKNFTDVDIYCSVENFSETLKEVKEICVVLNKLYFSYTQKKNREIKKTITVVWGSLRKLSENLEKEKINQQQIEKEKIINQQKIENLEFEKSVFICRTVLESSLLKNFKPTKVIGTGQYGVVVEVQHFKQIFCLKSMFNLYNFETQDINRKLIDTERIYSIPLHKNIIPIFRTFKDVLNQDFKILFRKNNCISKYSSEKTGFIVTPLYEQDFEKFFKERKIEKKNPPFFGREEIINFLEQLLDGICFLHYYQIAHRDLKPCNILIQGNQLIIGDFGCHINFINEGKDNLTLKEVPTGFPKGGSPFFLSPEILNENLGSGSTLNYSKSDLFSVGLIIYLILSPYKKNEKIIGGKEMIHFSPFSGWGSDDYEQMRVKKNYVDLPSCYDEKIRNLIKKMLCPIFNERISCFEALEILKKLKKKIK